MGIFFFWKDVCILFSIILTTMEMEMCVCEIIIVVVVVVVVVAVSRIGNQVVIIRSRRRNVVVNYTLMIRY